MGRKPEVERSPAAGGRAEGENGEAVREIAQSFVHYKRDF